MNNFLKNRNLGDCYRILNSPTEALEKYELAKQHAGENNKDINHRIAIVKHTLGIKYFNKSKWREALKHFDEAVNLNKT